MRAQIESLLLAGLSTSQCAAAVGCDDSYVSQVASNPEFASQLAAARAARTVKHLETDESIDDAEAMALKKVKGLIPMITKPLEAVRVFGVLNAARRKAEVVNPNANEGLDTVVLNLPKNAAVAIGIQVSSERQVIEVEGRSMTTMPAKALQARLEQRKASQLLETQVPQTLTLAHKL